MCVYEGAQLQFHAPFYPSLDGVYEYDAAYTAEFLKIYPKAIQAWIGAHGGLTYTLTTLEGPDLYRIVPLCNAETALTS